MAAEAARYVPSHIAGNPRCLTDEQRALIELAARLGREKFAPRAARYDRDASFPFENYDDLREAGLLGICVPKAYGGLGADFTSYALVSAEIGRHCGATALTRFDRREQLARIAVPTLCITGEHDRNAPPSLVQQMA
ncbi:MAG TPA: acyl-CoA dehydrogenase family protein, partial [Burkholderiaceae bacterium]|nr:acyl-CoA dehydrogenase family protein [Burkholderiaceae bacterium]